MSKKLLTVQDISCYGQCSITVALPILSAKGIETAILPSAILSTHTCGFKDFTVLDLTNEMSKIINHWKNEKIKFDCLYTGYIGDVRQFKDILDCKETLLNKNALFIVDPAMADNGKLYPALSNDIVRGMQDICKVADFILPNITEACFLTNTPYRDKYEMDYIDYLLNQLLKLGAKKVILTGVEFNGRIGAIFYDGKDKIESYQIKEPQSYHGTGDIFSSIIIANILNNYSIKDTLENATKFIVDCIKKTVNDKNHDYGVKFEDVLKD